MGEISEKANHEWIEAGRPLQVYSELSIEIDGILEKDFLPGASAYAYTFPGPTLSEIPFDGGSPRASRMGGFFLATKPLPSQNPSCMFTTLAFLMLRQLHVNLGLGISLSAWICILPRFLTETFSLSRFVSFWLRLLVREELVLWGQQESGLLA